MQLITQTTHTHTHGVSACILVRRHWFHQASLFQVRSRRTSSDAVTFALQPVLNV